MLSQAATQRTEFLGFPTAIPTGQKDNSTKPFAQRQKLEIERLRRESIILEGELSRLQRQRRWLSTRTTTRPGDARRLEKPVARTYVGVHGFRTIAPRKPVKRFVWKEIAKRQWEERMRAENRNQELRSCLEVECVVRQQLELLRQRLPDEEAMPMVIPRIVANEVVFNDLLVRVENMLLEVDVALRGVAYRDRNADFINASVVRDDNNTEAFVVHSNMTMPFCFQVVSRATWKVLSSDSIKNHCYYHQVVQKSDAAIAYSFGAQQTSQEVTADIRGKYVVCRFKDFQRIML